VEQAGPLCRAWKSSGRTAEQKLDGLAAYHWALCNTGVSHTLPATLASRGLLRFPGRLRAPWPATLQSVKACRPCFGLAASLTHEPRRPLAQVQRISHESGERSIDVEIVPS